MAEKRKSKKRKEDLGDAEKEKPSREEYFVAKWLKANVTTKKTKFLNHPVEYFTGAKAVDALLTSKWATGKNQLFTTRQEVTQFCHQMLLHKFFHRAKKVPVTEQELKGKKKKDDKNGKSGDEKEAEKSQASACEGNEKETKEKEKDKKKRKIRLEMHMEQVFLDTTDAYVWIFDPMPWYYWLFGALVVLATVAICMFPLWPPTVRKGVYHLSVAAAAFLVVIIALAALRLAVFCAVWLLTLSRHHLWLLPNLTEDVGFFASFWPFYKYEYRGPSSDSDKAAKMKKKRKKDKQSDDETDDKAAPPEPAPAPPAAPTQPAPEPPTAPPTTADDCPEDIEKKESESESENSQRSSTDRDFEMVDQEDLEDQQENEERPLVSGNTA